MDTVTKFGRRANTTLFVVNGASPTGLGLGGQGYLSYSIATPTHEPKTKNTDDLFMYLRDGHMRALNHLDEYMRALYVKAAADAEWYTLNAALNVPAMREIYDTPRIAERIRVLAQQMNAGPRSGAD